MNEIATFVADRRSTASDDQRVERVMTALRFGAAAVLLLFGPVLPNAGTVFVTVLGVFCFGYGAILARSWGRIASAADRELAARFALAADISLVGFALLVFSPDPGWAVYACGFVVIASGAFRLRNGAILAAASLSLTYVVVMVWRESAFAITTGIGQAGLQLAGYLTAGLLLNAVLPELESLRTREHDERHRALHDALTGLPNRTLLDDRLEAAIAIAQRNFTPLSLLLLDLDGFKKINDTLGHEAGDVVLVEVARRLSGALRASDTAARLGGDEFVVLLPGTPLVGAADTARVLVDVISRPITIGLAHPMVGASIGVAVFPDQGRDAKTLLAAADAAMYSVKQNGGGYRVSAVEARAT